MTDDVKNELTICLHMLKQTILRNELSMGFDKNKKALVFFDTRAYVDSGRMDGVAVPLETMVLEGA